MDLIFNFNFKNIYLTFNIILGAIRWILCLLIGLLEKKPKEKIMEIDLLTIDLVYFDITSWFLFSGWFQNGH
jgi:hypothetical protein